MYGKCSSMLIDNEAITARDHRTKQQIILRQLGLSGTESGWIHWLKKKKLPDLWEAAIKMSQNLK